MATAAPSGPPPSPMKADEIMRIIRTVMAAAAEPNGPSFCSRLAQGTGCRVRAAMIPQTEEGTELDGNADYLTIGDWEGHVIDYLPSGAAQYVGKDVPRPMWTLEDAQDRGPLGAV